MDFVLLNEYFELLAIHISSSGCLKLVLAEDLMYLLAPLYSMKGVTVDIEWVHDDYNSE